MSTLTVTGEYIRFFSHFFAKSSIKGDETDGLGASPPYHIEVIPGERQREKRGGGWCERIRKRKFALYKIKFE